MNDPSQPQSPFTRPSFLISAVVVLLLIIAGLIVALTGGGKGDEPNANPSPNPTASASPKSNSTCGLEPGPQEPLTSAPLTDWKLIGKLAAPTSKSAGPARTSDGIHSCFAQDATGALFAAATFASELANPELYGISLVETRTAPGPGRDEALAELRRNPSPDTSTGDAPTVQYAGFRYDDYTLTRASVVLAWRVTDGPNVGGLFSISYTTVWIDGDWKIEFPSSGQAKASQLSSLDGFVPWSGA